MTRYIEVWLEHPSVGMGVRRFLDVSKPKAKQATLLYIPTLTKFTIDPREIAKAREIPLNKGERRRLMKRIRAKLRERKRLGLRIAGAQAKAAILTLDA